jgi:hypothetical protein
MSAPRVPLNELAAAVQSAVEQTFEIQRSRTRDPGQTK